MGVVPSLVKITWQNGFPPSIAMARPLALGSNEKIYL